MLPVSWCKENKYIYGVGAKYIAPAIFNKLEVLSMVGAKGRRNRPLLVIIAN